MEFEFGYSFTKKAEEDFDEIISYIAVELANPKAASGFADKLQESIDTTRTFPESGAPLNNEFLQVENVRKKFVGNYVMYYFPDMNAKVIYILRIVYGKRNMDEIIKELI